MTKLRRFALVGVAVMLVVEMTVYFSLSGFMDSVE
jgi:hypothetical protein